MTKYNEAHVLTKKFIENDVNMTSYGYPGENVQQGYNIITQHKNLFDNSMNMDLYNYNPITEEYNKLVNLSFPNSSGSIYNFTKGSKDVYIHDETFNDKSLYVLKNNKVTNMLELKTVDFFGPTITSSSQESVVFGINYERN